MTDEHIYMIVRAGNYVRQYYIYMVAGERNKIIEYMKETFVPSIEEILLKVINLYRVTIERESCVIGRCDKLFTKYFVNDTFMEDYIYRFIGFRNTISEYCKIMNEHFDEKCKITIDGKYPLFMIPIDEIFHISSGYKYIIMSLRIKGYEFNTYIYVEEKYRDSIRSIIGEL